MAQKVEIAEFNIDIEQLTNAAAETAKAINQIREEQKQLVKDGKQSDQAFVRNQVNLRGLQKDYNAQLKVLDRYINTSSKQIPIQQRIDAAMRQEVTNINQLREQNKQLTAIRNEVNIETEEGQEQLAQLNAQLDINNNLIKQNVSELEQQKIGIGSYADSIKEALSGTDLFSGTLGEIKNLLGGLTPIFQTFRKDISSVADGFKNAAANTEGMTAAQKASVVATNLTSTSLKALRLALIGTGIGAIVVLLGSFIAYLQSSEQASNRLGRILGQLGGIVAKLLDYLQPLGEFIMDVLVQGFELLGQFATKALNDVAEALSFLGFDNAATSVRGFTKDMQEAARAGDQLTQATQKLTEEQRKQGIVQLQYQQQAERLRQIRDDESRTMADRIKANEELGNLLNRQLEAEQNIARQALYVANLRIAQDGATAANLDAQAEAMERMVDIQERITGQESEQLTNRNSLLKEGADRAKEAAQERIEQMNAELDLLRAQQGVRARTLDEELAFEEMAADKRRSILDAELKAKLVSMTEYSTAMLEIDNELAERRAEIAQQNFEKELAASENRIEIERAMSEARGKAAIQEEERRAQELRDARANYEAIRFQEGITSEIEYQNAVDEINQQYQLKQIELQKQTNELLRQQKSEQMNLDFETEMAALESQSQERFEIEGLRIEQDRERRLEEARQRYTDEVMLAQAIANINAQANNAQIALDRERNQAIWQGRADLASAISTLVGEETALGKAAAIAQATINTYLGVTQALATLPPPASWIAAATSLATGLGAVGQITGISASTPKVNVPQQQNTATAEQTVVSLNAIPPFATGGRVKGGIPIRRSNGDNVLASLKIGEVVLNERQQAALGGDATFRALGIKGFATGGLVTGSSMPSVQRTLMSNIDMQLAEVIGDAVRDGSYVGTEQGSRNGIMDLSTERYLQNLSTF